MNVLLGVTGGIAAYKSAFLVRLLVSRGHSVRVVMTAAARDFITPLTMATLSQHPVAVEGFSAENGAWNSHISLGEWAEVMLIAPATANTLAKMAAGIADNLLLCTYLSARCAVVVAPAMDLDMWAHSATRQNIEKLRLAGVKIVEPGDGFLASGLSGKGRMAEPETIVEQVFGKRDFEGKRILITSGATVERIDPVRYISNFSTGKMGRALAAELQNRGAVVDVVSGQVSAKEMLEQARERFAQCDIAIFAAAVADYTPREVSCDKIKHGHSSFTLTLDATTDIAATLSATKREGQFTVGFALETSDGMDSARAKLSGKSLDAIVLNSLLDDGAGFGVDTNKITIIDATGSASYELKSKQEVARDIADYIAQRIEC